MKRAISLLLTIVLCLSLCACGELQGEKAAGLYPDIIGNWGVDPFGEAVILRLDKDGTCTVLDNPGTWFLNEKLSDQGQVTLTAKTEHTSYSIQLNRVPGDTQSAFYPVHLVIMDSKQKMVVYEAEVFKPEKTAVSHELALQTVPELVGEWGSVYWNEESVLTIRDDGTCTLQRQPGRWCLRSDGTIWPNVIMLIKLDTGKQFRCEVSTPEPVIHLTGLQIFEEDTDAVIYPQEDRGYAQFSVNRTLTPSMIEIIPEAVGTWADAKDPTVPVVTFNEDGTCKIFGGSGVWAVDYHRYLKDLNNGITAGSAALDAKINGNDCYIYFDAYDDGTYNMTVWSNDLVVLSNAEVVRIPEN